MSSDSRMMDVDSARSPPAESFPAPEVEAETTLQQDEPVDTLEPFPKPEKADLTTNNADSSPAVNPVSASALPQAPLAQVSSHLTQQDTDEESPRKYFDANVVPVLLEGMKLLAKERPSEPLAYLGRYLLEQSQKRGGENLAGATGGGTEPV